MARHVSLRSVSFEGNAPSIPSSSIYRMSSIKKTRTPSVHGGAGGSGTRISFGSNYSNTFGSNLLRSTSTNDLLLTSNEKTTMQNLNDRLAVYLEKVRSLETSNSVLERQIREWYEKSSPIAKQDYNAFFKVIEELQDQITKVRMDNTRIILQIDNSKLAADDFRVKYETEVNLRKSVENDITGLQGLIDELTLIRTDLEHQIENLNEELVYLKKQHEEETARLRGQLSGDVSVEVDAAPGIDLAQVMENMRRQYEVLAEKNRQEAKDQFDKLIEQLNVEVTTTTHELETHRSEITDRRNVLQSLEIELQSQLSWKTERENALAEAEARYRTILTQIQMAIGNIEAQLMQLRSDMEQQSMEYSILLDIKVKLEAEIATYRRLLEGEDWRMIASDLETNKEVEKEKNKTLRIKTVVEEMVDGKVVSSKVNEREEKM
ncbi:keratin, type I cytoskeletal 19-like [Erythrolamprus reginae]|uniref:keratin, type I cytoskeletal 19-like n=1 Tax=Erythrolamprus reginae TaxID=121349 RepID=UPI00396CD6EC